MEWFSMRRDGLALAVLVLSIVMVASGLSGNARLFGYAVVVFIGLLTGLGFVRTGVAATWWPPVVATSVLIVSLTGAFAFEGATVASAAETTLGFQPGTAFVIYGIWIPTLFTLGLTYVLLFDRLDDRASSVAAGNDR